MLTESRLPAPVRDLLESIGDARRPLAELPAAARDALLAGVADGLLDCYAPLLRAVDRVNHARFGVPLPSPDATGRVAETLGLLARPVGAVVALTPLGRAVLARDRVAQPPSTEAGGESTRREGRMPKPCEARALAQYEHVCRLVGRQLTLKEAHRLARDRADGEALPQLATWARHVRAGHKAAASPAD